MGLSGQATDVGQVGLAELGTARVGEDAQRAARRSMREQIARLERELSGAFVTAFELRGVAPAGGPSSQPRVLDLGELELVRDELAERLHAARASIAERAEVHAANRVLLERMLLEPGKYRFVRVARQDLGEPGCGVWQVRPRLGLIGMLAGWWQVKLSSGCPLAMGSRLARAATPSSGRESCALPCESTMVQLLRTGTGAMLVVLIMIVGSLVLWIGTPLLWLWVGSQVQGSTSSLGAALGVMLIGVVLTIAGLSSVLVALSNIYRRNCAARGLDDPGHVVLEGVLVVSAGFTLVAFVVWFFLFAGADPVPLGIQI